jgi:hypothetical protein
MGKVEHVDLDPLDVISFPPGAIRRFENVASGDPNQENILMFVIGVTARNSPTKRCRSLRWPASGHQKPVESVRAGQSRSGNRTRAVEETQWLVSGGHGEPYWRSIWPNAN